MSDTHADQNPIMRRVLSRAKRSAALAAALAVTAIAATAPAAGTSAASASSGSDPQLCPYGHTNPIIGCQV